MEAVAAGLNGAVAEPLRMLAEFLLRAVCNHAGDGGAGAGQGAHEKADQRTAEGGHADGLPLLLVQQGLPDGDLAVVILFVPFGALLQLDKHLAEAEQAHQHGDGVQAVQQVDEVEGESLLAGNGVNADGAQQQAEDQHQIALEGIVSRDARHQAQAHQGQGKHLRSAEFQGYLRQGTPAEGQTQSADQSAYKAGEGGHAERLSSFPPPGEGIAVQRTHGGSRRAGDVNQNGGDGAAIHGAVVNAGQHDQAVHRVHAEGQRQQDGRTGSGAQTGQQTGHIANEHAGQEVAHGLQSKDLLKAFQQTCKSCHIPLFPLSLRSPGYRRGS